MVEGKNVNIVHRKYFVLNDDFEDILDTLGDSKEIGNDIEEDYEGVSNTKVIYLCMFFFITCFKVKEKFCKKISDSIGLLSCKLNYATENVLKLKIVMITLC